MNGTRMSDITPSEGEKEEFCAVCKCLAKQKCSACKSVYYCTREHQKLDWKTHSKNCQAFILVENSTMGRHYIATRDIKMNEIILMENEPLLVAPLPNTLLVCLNCYVPLTLENAKPCGNCGLPLCFNCTRHGPECQLTMKYQQSKVKIHEYSIQNMLYMVICVLRAFYLRLKSPDCYKKLLNLQCHYTDVDEFIPGTFLSEARNLKKHLKIKDLDEQEILRIIGIVGVNGYLTSTPKGYGCVAVFDKASYIAHDCRPNCRWDTHYDANNGPKILIRAVRMIPKGQSITVSYTQLLDGTMNRRKILSESKYFDCTCERCKDPTEFGTMFNSVKCFQKDCTGYMLPSTFLVPKDKQIPDFVCDKCKLTTPSTKIDEIMKEASMQLSKIKPKDQDQLKKFIDKHSMILHQNHFHIVNAQIKVFHGHAENENLVGDQLCKEQITLCKKLADLLEILAPSDYEKRGAILYGQCTYMIQLNPSKISQNRCDRFIWYEDCMKVFNEASELLRYVDNDNWIRTLELTRSCLKALHHCL